MADTFKSRLIRISKGAGIALGYTVGTAAWLGLCYVIIYWVFWKGGRWLVSTVGALDLSDPLTGRITGALVALAISTFGVVLTVAIRRSFRAQELVRFIDLIEAHRASLAEGKHVVPNAVFPDDLKDLVRFVSPRIALRTIAIARTCQRVYDLIEIDSDASKERTKSLIDQHLKTDFLVKVALLLSASTLIGSLKQPSNIKEEELFNDSLV